MELFTLGSLDVAAVVLLVPENIFADVIPPINVIDIGYQICDLISYRKVLSYDSDALFQQLLRIIIN